MPSPAKDVLVSKKDVGDRVRELRKARELSQGKLAAALGIPPTNVSAIERGVRGLSIQQLVKLARVLDVSPAEILGDQPGPTTRRKPGPSPKRFDKITALPRAKRRVLFEIIDAFLEKHGNGSR